MTIAPLPSHSGKNQLAKIPRLSLAGGHPHDQAVKRIADLDLA